MSYEYISYNEFLKYVSNTKSAFLCGNGFSINFDERYRLSNLVDRLYEVHCYLYNTPSNHTYTIESNKKFKEALKQNYKNTLKVMSHIKSKQNFEQFFEDAINFAYSITKNIDVINWIKANNYNPTLKFELSSLDLVYNIISQSEKYGTMYVNYEYWTILIYFVLVLQNIPSSVYTLNQNNMFVKAVIYGNSNTDKVLDTTKDGAFQIFSMCVINGVYTYIRFLFTTTILLNGDSFNTFKLKNWNKYDLSVLNEFLSNFNSLITTNYDMILENITQRSVNHLHGSYSKQKRCIFSQSLGVYYNLIRYDLSAPIIGDYLIAKSFLPPAIKLSNKFPFNFKTELYDKQLERIIASHENNTIVIFGLNIDNDYHIIRSIQFNLSKLNNPHIIYCYFNDNDKDSFLENYKKCITYSPEINSNVNNIKISLIDSKEIIRNIYVEQ
jgi:hypothetical protein